ncbi:major facilitator superfamily domain-containing protein, partial [Amylocarpus encephaloides]
GETLGWVGTSMGVGFLLAPLLGGVVYEKAGYYAVYYMAFALIAIDIILRLALVEKKIAVQWTEPERSCDDPIIQPRDSSGSVTLDTGDEEKRMAADLSARRPDLSATNGHATRRASRLPPVLTLLTSRRLLTALWGCVVQGSLMTAFDSVVPLFVQDTFGWNSTGAGLIFLAVTIPSFISPFLGYLSDTYGPRWLTVFGFLFAIPFWILLRLVTHDTLSQKVLFCALLALIGVGLAFVLPPLMAEITYAVEAKERERPGRFGKTGAYASAYGLFIAAFATGTLIGPVWSGYVRDDAGWGTMSWTLGLFSFAGAVPCALWTGGNLYGRKSEEVIEDSGGDKEMRVAASTINDPEVAIPENTRSLEKTRPEESAPARAQDDSADEIKQTRK